MTRVLASAFVFVLLTAPALAKGGCRLGRQTCISGTIHHCVASGTRHAEWIASNPVAICKDSAKTSEKLRQQRGHHRRRILGPKQPNE
jgi:hypothetical protein